MKIGKQRKPIPIYTAEIKDKTLPSGVLPRFLEANYKKIAVPTSQALDEVNQRVQQFLEEHRPAEEISETRRLPKGMRDETYKSKKSKTREIKKTPKGTD